MFEGKNIHLSPVDGKPLCSFSRKLCRQRRLHGYAFCIRHILEDKNAPFKQCQYTTKSGETCINPVPIGADRLYCNNHMHLMGLLPKPIKKIIDKKGSSSKPNLLKSKNNKTQDNTALNIKPIQHAKRSKPLNVKKPKIENTWLSTFAKATEHANIRLKLWQQRKKSKCIEDLIAINNTSNDDVENSTCYRLGVSSSLSSEGCTVESFQRNILSTYERVHHNVLEVDDVKTQETKLVRKLKHQCAQLKQVIRHKQESVSYTVLSKLVECARHDPLETANVLNITENIHCASVCKIFRSREKQTRYVVPCCLLTENERCVKPALPYTRYCADHISDDNDQLLFIHQADKKTSATGSLLRFLHSNDVSRRYGSSEITAELKRNNKRNSFKKPSHRKKSKIKRTTNSKKVANRNQFRLKCLKQYDIQDFRKDTKKLRAHINTDKKLPDINENDTEDVLSDVEHSDFPVECFNMGNAPTLSESSSDSDSDSDILTPEEAFHLPPGSLSFPTGMDDDDALSGLRNSSMADDEEDELIRCDSNFTLDPAKQSMINRELSSPTGMDDLSEFDQSIGMFLANTDTTELLPSSPNHLITLPSPTNSVVSSSMSNFFSSIRDNSGNLEEASVVNSTPNDQMISSTSSFTSSHHPPNLHSKKYSINGPIRRASSNLGPSTLLKISPVNINPRQGTIPIRSYTSKPLNGQIQPGNQQTLEFPNNKFNLATNKTLEFPNNKKPAIINENYSLNSSVNHQSKVSNLNISQSKTVLQNGSCWNNGDALYNSLCCENDVLNEIVMDEDTPLEKVNPDIFFTSAFPVATCQADL